VVGIINVTPLVDGTTITHPSEGYFALDCGWGLENCGSAPDVEVAVAPHDYAAGRDPQLEEALRSAMDMMLVEEKEGGVKASDAVAAPSRDQATSPKAFKLGRFTTRLSSETRRRNAAQRLLQRPVKRPPVKPWDLGRCGDFSDA
jgi:hypothetical protein